MQLPHDRIVFIDVFPAGLQQRRHIQTRAVAKRRWQQSTRRTRFCRIQNCDSASTTERTPMILQAANREETHSVARTSPAAIHSSSSSIRAVASSSISRMDVDDENLFSVLYTLLSYSCIYCYVQLPFLTSRALTLPQGSKGGKHCRRCGLISTFQPVPMTLQVYAAKTATFGDLSLRADGLLPFSSPSRADHTVGSLQDPW